MKQYHDLLKHILENGVDKGDRTGTGTRSVFGYQNRYDLQKGFPLVTTKKAHWKSVVHELLWFISGSTNIKYLKENGVSIWDEWADADGELGPVYGKQWRSWEQFGTQSVFNPASMSKDTDAFLKAPIDQLANVIERIKTKPDDRRLIVTAWNPADVDKVKLPPCHSFFQFWTAPLSLEARDKLGRAPGDARALSHADWNELGVPSRKLSCHMYQRSADSFLGVPFNIASYALLTHMVAQVTGMVADEFIHSFGDLHIYNTHFSAVKEQLSRDPRPLPTLWINPNIRSIDDFKFEDFLLEGYDPHPVIRAPVAV